MVLLIKSVYVLNVNLNSLLRIVRDSMSTESNSVYQSLRLIIIKVFGEGGEA